MAEYDVDSSDDYRQDSGMASILAVLLVLALVAFLIWALAFGGFDSLTGSATTGPGSGYTTTSLAGGTTGAATARP